MKNWHFLTLICFYASLSGCASTPQNLNNYYSINGQRTSEYWFADSSTETQNQQVERVNYFYCSFTKNCDK